MKEQQRQFHHAMTYNETLTIEEGLVRIISAQLDPYFGTPSLEAGLKARPGHFRITQDSLNAMEFSAASVNLGVRIRIIDGGKQLLYRQLTKFAYGHIKPRLATTMNILEEMILEGYFKDWRSPSNGVDFIVFLHGPASGIHSHAVVHGLPIFTYISSDFHSDLILPDPLQFGAHGTYLWPNISELVPWHDRMERVIFRGKADCYNFHSSNWFSCTRVRGARLSKMYPDEIDIGITEFNHLDWDTPPFVYQKKRNSTGLNDHPPTTKEIESQTNITRVPFMSFQQQSAYKYILDIDGSTGSSRKAHIIGSGSVLFNQKSPWKRWFEPLFIPFVHYVPVNTNLEDLRNKVLWARRNDEHMQRIVQWGLNFKNKFLSLSTTKLYIKLLLDGYKQLLVDPVTTADVTMDYCKLQNQPMFIKAVKEGPMRCSTKWLHWSKKKFYSS